MLVKVVKDDKEILDLPLDEAVKGEFLSDKNRVKVESIGKGHTLVLTISKDKVLVIYFSGDVVIYRSFGFDVENYISDSLSETLSKVFQNIGLKGVDGLNEKLEELEDEVFGSKSYSKLDEALIKDLYLHKKYVDEMRRYYFLQEEILEYLGIEKRVLFQVRRIRTSLERLSESINALIGIYLEMVDTTANEIMKVLTIVATIFIPLSFITGVYGMNFKYMPELGWKFSYQIFWVFSIIFAVISLIFFKRRGWI